MKAGPNAFYSHVYKNPQAPIPTDSSATKISVQNRYSVDLILIHQFFILIHHKLPQTVGAGEYRLMK